MKTARRLAAALAVCLALPALFLSASAAAPVQAPEALTILFTHDTHDHFYPDASGTGGYTRLASLLRRERELAAGDTAFGERGRAVVTLDGGDFSMGSPFQTVYATDAPELRALGAMGYDAVTLGNHEYDYRPQGLADMLRAAKEADGGEQGLPAIVQANYKTPKVSTDPAAQALEEAMDAYPVTDYTLLRLPGHRGMADRNELRVAVFGIMGVDSDECAPMSGMALEEPIAAARRVVEQIQKEEEPDYIICLSHSGTEAGRGEDYELAKAVPGIDVIISGHTHSTLAEPIEVNGTFIVSCGPYTQNLGRITIGRSGTDGAAELLDYALLPLDTSVSEDGEMMALAERFKAKVDENYLSHYGMRYDEVLARSGEEFTIAQTGDLIGESYIAAVREAEGEDYVPVAFAVVPDGVIRGQIPAGEITAGQAFDILSLGVGADGTPGYPLVSVYLTGKELKNAFEVDASISALMPAAALYGAGCQWEYNSHRMFLDRLTACRVLTEGVAGEVEDDRLYRVVADLYSGQMLSAVEEKSFGLLSITPRDETGAPVADLESRILRDGGGEIKAWHAFARYLRDTPGELSPPPAGKTAADSWNPIRLLIPMGAPTAVVVLLAVVLVLAAAAVIRKLRSRRRRDGFAPPYRGK